MSPRSGSSHLCDIYATLVGVSSTNAAALSLGSTLALRIPSHGRLLVRHDSDAHRAALGDDRAAHGSQRESLGELGHLGTGNLVHMLQRDDADRLQGVNEARGRCAATGQRARCHIASHGPHLSARGGRPEVQPCRPFDEPGRLRKASVGNAVTSIHRDDATWTGKQMTCATVALAHAPAAGGFSCRTSCPCRPSRSISGECRAGTAPCGR